MQIREVQLTDAPAIARITNHYIQHTNYLLDLSPITEEQITKKIKNTTPNYPYLVAEDDGKVVGFAYGYAYDSKAGYSTTAGTTIYLDPSAQGKGYGARLYNGLLKSLPMYDIQVAIGGITSGNEPSVALHKKLGFKKVAHFEKVAYKFDECLDVEYWQKQL